MQVREEVLGTNTEAFAQSLAYLAEIYDNQRDYAKAESLLLQSVQIRKQLAGEMNLAYAQAIHGLSLLYKNMGNLAAAEPLEVRSVEIHRKVMGPTHSFTGVAVLVLGRLYAAKGDFAQADRSYREALAIFRVSPGERSPLHLDSLDALAALHEQVARKRTEQEDFAAARTARDQVLTLKIERYGAAHWQVTDAKLVLADLERRAALGSAQRKQLADADRLMGEVGRLSAAGKNQEALERARQALAIRQQLLGADHPDTGLVLNWLGKLQENLRDLAGAEASLGQTRDIYRKALGEAHPRYATLLNSVGNFYLRKGDYARAEPLMRQALDIRTRVLGSRHADVFQSLGDLGLFYDRWAADRRQAGDYASAKKALEQALTIKTRRYGTGAWQATDARLDLAHGELLAKLRPDQRKRLDAADQAMKQINALDEQAKYAEAVKLTEQALATRRELLSQDHRQVADCLGWLAALSNRRGDLSKAAVLRAQDLEIRTRVLGPEHPHTAYSLCVLGFYYTRQSEYAKAEPLLHRAEEIQRRTLGVNHLDYALTLRRLAEWHYEQGEYARAEPLLRQSLDIRKRLRGDKDLLYAHALHSLALLYQALGDYVRTEPIEQQAADIYRHVLGERHPDYAKALESLGRLYAFMGDYQRAEQHHRQALAVHQEKLGEDHPSTAACLADLAEVCVARHDLAQAEQLYRHALEIRRKTLGKEHPACADVLASLGRLAIDQNDYAKARPLLEEALAIRKKVYGEEHLKYASSLTDMGWLLRRQGEYAKAEPYFRQGVEIRRRILGERHPEYAESLSWMSRLYRDAGNLEQAESQLRQCLDAVRKHMELTLAVQSERQQLAMAQKLRGYLDLYVSLARTMNLPGETAYGRVLAWKGMVFAEQLQAHDLRGLLQDGSKPELVKLYSDLQATANQLAALSLAPADPAKPHEQARQMRDLVERQEQLERQLSRGSAAFRQHKARQQLTSARLQQVLPKDAALLDFLEYNYSPPRSKSTVRGERHLAVFVVRTDRAIELLDLGPVRPIAEEVDRWRLTLRRGHPVQSADDPGAALRRLLWQPIEPHLKDVKTLLISPDGALARLPFAALPGSNPDKYLLEEFALAVVPVPQLLPELLDRAAPATAGRELPNQEKPSLLLVGDVDYGAKPGDVASENAENRPAAARSGKKRNFKPLPATADEIVLVKNYFERRFRGGRVQLFEGAEATVSDVSREAARHRWLHIATHGFFSPPDIRSALAGSSAASGAGIDAGAESGFHPGLLSGLALAGANQQPKPDQADGILTALQVSALDLRSVELAVLSACETGLGQAAGGEGILGLQRSFQVAGARSVIGSLWSVDDEGTQKLMARFYENLWKKKLTKADALREAQLWMLKEGPRRSMDREPDDDQPKKLARTAPYYWAAFVLSGDWR
jgi:CHAT domain-containing protein/uncharacterized protein HemY